jgi:hypothetical protein
VTKINKVSENNRRPFLTPKNTGYLAAGALVLSSARAFNKSKPVVKDHKYIGFVATFLTLLHIGVVEYLHFKYKKM